MKSIEKDSGRGCESPQVHHKHIKVPYPVSGDGKYRLSVFIMGLTSFDRVKSNEMDSPAM